MSHQQTESGISIDEIPVDLDLVHRSEFTRADIPDEIKSITWSLLSKQPPTNPLVVFKAVHRQYIHEAGEPNPAYCQVTEWVRHLTTGEATASGLLGERRQYLHSLECEDTDQQFTPLFFVRPREVWRVLEGRIRTEANSNNEFSVGVVRQDRHAT